MKHKKQRAQGDKPIGLSKYAAKRIARSKAARRAGLPADSTWPVIWAAKEEAE
jgi:hypothetical protein